MYQNYFGLKEQAFSIAVNPRYLYMSHQHKEALAHLLYGVKEGGFVMLTGEVGTGKTTIIRCLLEQMPPKTQLAIILNPMANIQELLCTMCDELGIRYDANKISVKSITDLLQKHLLDNYTQGKKTVLLIDEAQLLSPEVLEQVRLLTNLETSSQKLLQIVLVGQPELNDLLAQPRLRQLSQRITARYHLVPLTLEETERYIRHRLSVAGMTEDRNPFSPRIIKQIHRFTGGIPRMINMLCERTLVGAYGHNKAQVDNQIFEMARREVEGNRPGVSASLSQQPFVIYGMLSASAIVGLTIIIFLMNMMLSPSAKISNAVADEPGLPAAPLDTGLVQRTADSTVQRTDDLIEQDTESSRVQLPKPGAELAAPESNFAIDNKLQAQAVLFDYLDLAVSADANPCWQVDTLGHQCSEATFATWDEVSLLNRPMVLSLINTNKTRSHVVLVGLQEKSALLINAKAEPVILSLDILGPLWTGEVLYTWKKPKDYTEPLSLGDRSQVITDVAQQFAQIDGQLRPLATRKFSRALQERIKIFQQEHNLKPDGILGERTLMKINESLQLSPTLTRDFL